MIRFVKKSDPQPPAEEAGGDGFKEIHAAADGKATNDRPRRRKAAPEDDGRLI
ncbi:hypothetical protein [Rhizobium etli]|jgi:hypothetical protein|uniref:hypothetical protein n=1 Tax=Rhizobium etli TaxID=29449 RepID=UPI00031AEEDB|nr:hypothetical protein [Rhizobium etli]